MKKCTRCKQEKDESLFGILKKTADGLSTMCSECLTARNKEYYLKHKEHISLMGKEYRKRNKERIERYIKNYRKNNPERVRSWGHKRDIKEMLKPSGRLNATMKTSIRVCLKGNKKWQKWESLVGYTVEDLKKHIEKKFKDGMSWDNYGTYWEVDHIIPKAAFHYENANDIDFKRCWELKNLQPLQCSINRRKKDYVEKPFQPSLNIAV